MAFYRVTGITKEKVSLVIPAIGVELDTGKVDKYIVNLSFCNLICRFY